MRPTDPSPSWFARRRERLRELLRPDPANPPRRWLKRHWLPLSALALAIAGVGAADAWIYTCGWAGCPSGAEIRSFRPAEGGRILDREGRMLGRVMPVRRVNVPLAQVPTHVRRAFVATEDRRFYQHGGLDWRGLARAVVRNVASGGIREGFSTITMQVARNSFAVDRMGERTIARKLIELRLSRLIEGNLSKDQILQLYLNVIYLGNGVYGVEAASRDLFGKGVRDVSLAEGAMLAALPKGPSAYTPRRAPERALRRRNLVLALMTQQGFLTREQAVAAARQRLALAKHEWRPDRNTDSYALDAVRAAVDSLREALNLQSSDLTVYTTVDNAAQRAAERAVLRRATAIDGEARGSDEVEGAMVALDPRTGDIRALVGGRRYEKGNFNRAFGAHRQPGSAFKPFVFAAALASGFTPASLVDDDPVEVEQGGRIWTPANYGDEYAGRITLRRALMRSANAATVRVSRSIGEPAVIAAAQRNGISSRLQPHPSIALGALEVTPLELVAAYAPFANGGYRVKPRLVRRIESADGTVLWTSNVEKSQVMDPRDAFQLTSMLRSVVDGGTGRTVRTHGVRDPVAGKTGTTNNGSDVWFVGYTPTLVAGFWFGFDTPRPLGGDASGGRLAAPAWAEFYTNGWKERVRGEGWQPPAGLVDRVIDAETGDLAGEWCPARQREWFKAGTEPTRRCTEHAAPPPSWEEPVIGEEGNGGNGDTWVEGVGHKLGKAVRKILRF